MIDKSASSVVAFCEGLISKTLKERWGQYGEWSLYDHADDDVTEDTRPFVHVSFTPHRLAEERFKEYFGLSAVKVLREQFASEDELGEFVKNKTLEFGEYLLRFTIKKTSHLAEQYRMAAAELLPAIEVKS